MPLVRAAWLRQVGALVWKDVKRAGFLSSVDAYVLAPVVGVTLLVIADRDASTSRLIDDILPVAETVAVSQVVISAIKFASARPRPYSYYNDASGTPYMRADDDRLSFPSGHASLGFSITAPGGAAVQGEF